MGKDHSDNAQPERKDRDAGARSAQVPQTQPNNPLHGVTLKAILEHMVKRHGWDFLADRVPVRCFAYDPSIKSSLKFLRRTEWARIKVERLYLQSVSGHRSHGG
ncbi:MAG: DUF2132 domain-containing protein [Myxococcales bacterium]|nr:DUF2132 domain-containing protein [Myxococcales bacterium]